MLIQVVSESVSHALLEENSEGFSTTSKFCLMMDHFFDCLNVTNYSECYKKLKPFKMPYRKVDDFRFNVSGYKQLMLALHVCM